MTTYKKAIAQVLGGLLGVNGPLFASIPPHPSQGVEAFQNHRWQDAMDYFLDALRQDPADREAHRYIPLTMHALEAHHRASVQETRIHLMQESTRRLQNNRQDARPLESALSDLEHSTVHAREGQWARWLEEARVERFLHHGPAAADLLLKIIAEKQDHADAQRELSLLLSEIQSMLTSNAELLVEERYALEGFYAYAHADYDAAAVAWRKARTVLQQTYSAPQVAQHTAALRFEVYAQRAEADVEARMKKAKLAALFARGQTLFNQGHSIRALDIFRQVAFSNPEYPQLGTYLVQSEAGVEKERTQRMTEARRQEIAAAVDKGVGFMEKENFSEAEAEFRHVLSLDPTNPSARSYLGVVQAEIQRRHDPKTAQAHYETGLIAYASGKLEEAEREWRIAIRMDPQNEKAVNAQAKVQKELSLAREVP